MDVYNSEGKIQLSKDLKVPDKASITDVEISVAVCLFACLTATVLFSPNRYLDLLNIFEERILFGLLFQILKQCIFVAE